MIIKIFFCLIILLSVEVILTIAQSDSQINLAYKANLIIIGESTSVSEDTFKSQFVPTNIPFVYQAVAFRVIDVLKGDYSLNIIRTMIAFPVRFLDTQKYKQHEIQKGDKYILMLKYKFSPNHCKMLPEKAYNDLSCYEITDNSLIRATPEEIEAISSFFKKRK